MGKIILTGDRPTGRLHVGHYVGSLKRRVELQNSGEYDKIFIMLSLIHIFLKALKAHHIKTGIATSNGRELADAVLNALGIAGYFDTVTVGCEVAAGKPAPDIYLETARRLQVNPEECVVFEDIPAGILAGKRAGMTVFAVEDEFSKELRAEKESLADYFIEDFLQLRCVHDT